MAEWANEFGLWAAQPHHIAPGTAVHRHDEATEAGATAAAVIAKDQGEEACTNEPNTQSGEREHHIAQKQRRRWTEPRQRRRRFGIKKSERCLETTHKNRGDRQFSGEIQPILH